MSKLVVKYVFLFIPLLLDVLEGQSNTDIFKKFLSDLGCVLKVGIDAVKCSTDSADKWKDTENKDKAKCCSLYDTLDCINDKVKEKCSSDTYNSFDKQINQYMDQISNEGECKDYGHRWYDPQSWKCHFPWILIAIIIGVIALLIVGGIIVAALYKKQKE